MKSLILAVFAALFVAVVLAAPGESPSKIYLRSIYPAPMIERYRRGAVDDEESPKPLSELIKPLVDPTPPTPLSDPTPPEPISDPVPHQHRERREPFFGFPQML